MRLTTKGRFAVTAMVDLAISGGERPVTLGDISERQKISLSYLEQLFGKLRRKALVSSVRGPGGGYRLTRPTTELSVGEIILAVDEPIDATQCGGKENCRDEQKCITHDLWTDLNRHIFEYLNAVKLSDLVEKQQQNLSANTVVELVDRRESKVSVATEPV
jgi:Rrf2 family transcriptional regulator, iron-sulfur cluster assembly transcription factor